MIIKITDDVITAMATFGDLIDGQTYDGKIPDGFLTDFKTGKYLLQNGLIVTNPDYADVTENPVKPSVMQTQLAALAYQQMTTQQTITDLQKQNAQMAYQLMTTQGGAKA